MPTLATDPPPQRTPHLFYAAILLAAFVIVGAGAFLGYALREGPRGVSRTWLGGAIGGSFELVDQNRKAVSNTDLLGRWLLVYFGYTHCPDACPTALNNMAVALHDLAAPLRLEVRAVFITIDPARDTPPVMKDYVASFDTPILALSGSAAQVAQAAKAYRVFYQRHPEPGGDYSLDHSSVIYVMDPQGRFAASLDAEAAPAAMAGRLKQLLGPSG